MHSSIEARDRLLQSYAQLSSGLLSDAMDRLDLPNGSCLGVEPVASGVRTVGLAVTVLFGRSVRGGPFDEYLELAAPGNVLVLANGGRTDCSVWGSLRSLKAQHRGIAGTFIDGACRDLDEQIEVGYPVFSRSRTMRGPRGLVAPAATEVPVLFAGVVTYPGDVVFGDDSGTIVIRRADAERVADEAERKAESEQAVRDRIALERGHRQTPHADVISEVAGS
jgi:4-hydroxy-4-methyl-2-oxoglutarate aldolase